MNDLCSRKIIPESASPQPSARGERRGRASPEAGAARVSIDVCAHAADGRTETRAAVRVRLAREGRESGPADGAADASAHAAADAALARQLAVYSSGTLVRQN